jgi:hypothetical protein
MDTRKCAKCEKEEATSCNYLEKTDTDAGVEYDCGFWWNDTLAPEPECDICPLTWCTSCKDETVVSAWAFIRIMVHAHYKGTE